MATMAMTAALPRYRFTVAEYELMGQAGILTEDDRVELIDGEIIVMSPIGPRHALCVALLTRQLARQTSYFRAEPGPAARPQRAAA
jgi:Uma2 family endonuclease